MQLRCTSRNVKIGSVGKHKNENASNFKVVGEVGLEPTKA
jgi:hypothetical protein